MWNSAIARIEPREQLLATVGISWCNPPIEMASDYVSYSQKKQKTMAAPTSMKVSIYPKVLGLVRSRTSFSDPTRNRDPGYSRIPTSERYPAVKTSAWEKEGLI
ncbi:uncharacterized protein LOC143174815 [Nomia melanderi]|uniref:uncharacterized protein LOC143174815 n=1 Tax=Nomia melanderi TaxID=2448451 RepID=UPI003FCE5587